MGSVKNEKSLLLLSERSIDNEVFEDMDKFVMTDAERFAHSIRIQFPKFSKGFNISDFSSFVESNIGMENLVSLGRLSFPNEWQMQLKTMAVREKLIRLGRTKISTRTCWITPLSHSEVRGYVHWIPTAVGKEAIKAVLRQFGEVLFIETVKYEKWDRVDSDSRYFALNLTAGKTMDDIPHHTKIEGHPGLITIRGRRPICFHCREIGHRKSECKKFKLKLSEYCQRKPNTGQKRIRPRGQRHLPSLVPADGQEGSKGKRRRRAKNKLQAQPENSVDSSKKFDHVSASQDTKGLKLNQSSQTALKKASSPQQAGADEVNVVEFMKNLDKLKTLITNFENVKINDSNVTNLAPECNNVDTGVQEKETGPKKKKKKNKKKKKEAVIQPETS